MQLVILTEPDRPASLQRPHSVSVLFEKALKRLALRSAYDAGDESWRLWADLNRGQRLMQLICGTGVGMEKDSTTEPRAGWTKVEAVSPAAASESNVHFKTWKRITVYSVQDVVW
jgi:hypothetical protein